MKLFYDEKEMWGIWKKYIYNLIFHWKYSIVTLQIFINKEGYLACNTPSTLPPILKALKLRVPNFQFRSPTNFESPTIFDCNLVGKMYRNFKFGWMSTLKIWHPWIFSPLDSSRETNENKTEKPFSLQDDAKTDKMT